MKEESKGVLRGGVGRAGKEEEKKGRAKRMSREGGQGEGVVTVSLNILNTS